MVSVSILLAVIVVIAAIGMPSARQQSPQSDAAIAEPEASVTAPAATAEAPPPAEAKAVEAKKIASATTTPAPAAVTTDAREAATLPAKGLPATTLGVVSESTVKSDTETSAPLTVTGCLEASDSGFRLEDTSGADVLKSRSWKSGFLRNRSSSIELVDAAGNTLQLSTHVGHRVSATGTLTNRTMRARSLQAVSASCR